MTHVDAIFKHISDSGATARSWSGLTPDLLEKARGRVVTLAWIMLVAMAAGAVIDLAYVALVIGPVEPMWLTASGFGVVISVALLVVATNRRVPHATALRAALAYEVMICFILAVLTPWFMYEEIGDVPYVTWVTPLIILFPLIVPSPPRLTLIAAIAAAATRPLGLLVLEVFAGIDISAVRYLGSSMSPAFAVVIAYFGARVVHGLTVDLSRARRMGSYQLESRLGTGGMGEVWRASHRLLARPAAVKLIHPETVARDPEQQRVAIGRFEREAQVTAALTSPHTIQLYDFGIEQSGTFYYVMELLDGLDLDVMVRKFGPLSPSRTMQLLVQVCDSLGEAHEHGLIHRDVKPANIYVCRYARKVDFAKVLDFGLVKFHRREDQDDIGLTSEHTIGGTPSFIAPEQVLGEELDGRADIYSVGCVAYWMLTGSYVFDGRTAWQTMMMHVQKAPEPPSARAPQEIPPSLERVVLACLEKDPARRPQNVDNLARDLAACDVGDAWTEARAAEWWTQHLPGQ
jgi:serine/threonine-protein kinase